MIIEELLHESFEAEQRFWFVQSVEIIGKSQRTLTLHLHIAPHLFVQAFAAVRSDRLSFALISPTGRLYGRDRVKGHWHRHPFGAPHLHEATPEGMSGHPLTQFLREVELLLLDNELL